MPIQRKIIQVGRSYAITLPKTWVENAEDQAGKKMVAVAMEVNGDIKLHPLFKNNNGEKHL